MNVTGEEFCEKDRQEHMAKRVMFVQMVNSHTTDEHGLWNYAQIEQRKNMHNAFPRKSGRTLRNFITMN